MNRRRAAMSSAKSEIASSSGALLNRIEVIKFMLLMPRGFLEPVEWRNNRWIIESPEMIKGSKKWRAKNRVRVALSTAKPPHSQYIISEPRKGMAENRLVITVAPQNDICPQGRTYPKKAVAITKSKIITPISHTSLKL